MRVNNINFSKMKNWFKKFEIWIFPKKYTKLIFDKNYTIKDVFNIYLQGKK